MGAPWPVKLRYLRRHHAFRAAPLRVALRLAAWRIRSLLGRPAVVRLPRWDVRLRLPPLWTGVAKLLYAFRERYERELGLLDDLLEPGARVVDVGASLGVYSLVSSALVGEAGRVLAVEPGSTSRRWLEDNIVLNGASNVEVAKVALSDHEGSAPLYPHADPGRYSLIPAEGQRMEAEIVPVESLDHLLARAGWPGLDLLKIDVEGGEAAVLRGARRSLERFRPAVIVELHPLGTETPHHPAAELLRGLGYELFTSVGDAGRLRPVRPAARFGNVVALHGADARSRG